MVVPVFIPFRERNPDGETFLTNTVKTMLDKFHADVTRRQNLMLDHFPGCELEYDICAGRATGKREIARNYYVGSFIYHVAVLGEKAELSARRDEVTQFLDSFRVLD